MKRVAIIGGGLTGLATAYYLGQAKPEWQINLYERDNRWGGKIQTRRKDGYVVELGPDSYLARKTAMTDFISALGLKETIVENATGQAYVYDKGKIHPIPGGSIVGIPTEILPFAMSSLLSWGAKLRSAQDWFKKPYPTEGDVSIGDFFRYHLGQEMMDKLIEPLLAGIYGGNIYTLSLDATFPEFHRLERKYGNMLKGMLALKLERAKSPVKASSQFRQLTGGLQSIVEAALEQMPKNVQVHLETAVTDIEKKNTDGYGLTLTKVRKIDKEQYEETAPLGDCEVDTLIITTPPQAYAAWFANDAHFADLIEMELSSCAIAVMAFDKASFEAKLQGTGFLITRTTDTPLTACTYMSVKWPQTTPSDKVVLRVFLGKPGDTMVRHLTEAKLGRLALREIQNMLHFTQEPIWLEVSRLNQSMPQYKVGHRERIATLKGYVEKAYPNLHLIGTPFNGVGMPDGVLQAKELVERLCNE